MKTRQIPYWGHGLASRNALGTLYCFPHAGAGASVYHAWGGWVSDALEVRGIRLPGRESRVREAAFTSVGPLADDVAQEIARHEVRPFALFGHSMGGLLAYEVATRLEGMGVCPRVVFLSGCRPPVDLGPRTAFSVRPDGELLKTLVELGGTSPEVLDSASLRAHVLDMLRADFALLEGYRPGVTRRLRCAVSVFGGSTDGRVPEASLRRWQEVAAGAFVLRMLAGGHFFYQAYEQEFAAMLAREFLACLRDVRCKVVRS